MPLQIKHVTGRLYALTLILLSVEDAQVNHLNFKVNLSYVWTHVLYWTMLCCVKKSNSLEVNLSAGLYNVQLVLYPFRQNEYQ